MINARGITIKDLQCGLNQCFTYDLNVQFCTIFKNSWFYTVYIELCNRVRTN